MFYAVNILPGFRVCIYQTLGIKKALLSFKPKCIDPPPPPPTSVSIGEEDQWIHLSTRVAKKNKLAL
jgi:hypothetical protein